MEREEFEKLLNESKVSLGNDACILAQCTDKLIIKKLSECGSDVYQKLFSHGLDIRVFSPEGETHIFRASMDKPFAFRIADDTQEKYDEDQFLDINTEPKISKPQEQKAVAIGGGKYHLPLNNYNDAKIKIRNYISYDEVGRAFVSDWRIVEFIEGGQQNG